MSTSESDGANRKLPDLRVGFAVVDDTDGKARNMIEVQGFFREGVKCFIKNWGCPLAWDAGIGSCIAITYSKVCLC